MRKSVLLIAAMSACMQASAGANPAALELVGKLFGVSYSNKDAARRTPLELWRMAASRDELLADWLCQDAKLAPREEFTEMPDAEGRILAAMEAAGANPRAFGSWPERVDDYRKACERRRAERLAALKAETPRWVYARHYVMGGSHYAYTEAQSDGRAERVFHRGLSRICMLEATESGLWKETVLLESRDGVYRDVDVSFDGKKVLYAFKGGDKSDDFHLYEMDLDTREQRQITFSRGFADYEGCYLPNGQIVFNSTRPVQVVDCWWTEVSNIYRCEADGSGITRMTFDQVHDNFPTLSWDGRIYYTRWEYNDRSQIFTQPLYAMDWDGTGQRSVYGDNSWYPTTIIHARAVDESPLVFAISTGHHSTQAGDLIRIDPRLGRQENDGVFQIAPLRRAEWIKEDVCGQDGAMSLYPYPLGEAQLVASHLPEGWPKWRRREGHPRPYDYYAVWEPFGFYWLDVEGGRELLAPRLDGRPPCGRMVPVRARRRMALKATGVRPGAETGTFFIHDIYEGASMRGVARGDVKSLRVVALEFRAAGIGNNGNAGPGGGALVSTPVAINNGAWDPKIVLGDVPVEEDGSCFFEAPCKTPVYFMALDGNGRMIQTMRSWTTLMPGENASCIGCHEGKNDAPPPANAIASATRKGVRKLKPFLRDGACGFSFRREVQPILDARCVRCHRPGIDDRPDLTSAPVDDFRAKRIWTRSYLSLTHSVPIAEDGERKGEWRGDAYHRVLNWISAASEPTQLKPRSYGSNASLLFSERLDKGHCPELLDEEKRVLAAWVDLGVPYCGSYLEAADWSEQEWNDYRTLLDKRKRSTDNTP